MKLSKTVHISAILMVGLIGLIVLPFQNCTSSFSTTAESWTNAMTSSADIASTGTVSVDQFSKMFPDKYSFLPKGVSYSDQVPITLDLAVRAESYISGVINTAHPGAYFAPTAAALSGEFSYTSPGPRLFVEYWGAPNWGEVMLALAQAREMTGFDQDDAHGTLSKQYWMMRNMLDRDVNVALGQNIVIPNPGVTPMTYAIQALTKSWEQNPRAEIKTVIDSLLVLQNSQLKTVHNSGQDYTVYYSDLSPLENGHHVGYMGASWVPFIQGTAIIGFADYQKKTGSTAHASLMDQLSTYLLTVQGSHLWVSPNESLYPFSPGKGFAGHMYSWLEAARGILLNADLQLSSNPAKATALIEFVRTIYDFVKARTNAGWVGNFGSSGTAADMVVLGIHLSELGAGDYYDEVDAWTRNQLMEASIDEAAAQYIENYNSSLWETNQVGNKVKGLFFADATHVRSIPKVSQAFTTDDHAMTFRGIYEVWSHITKVKGSNAYVNFHLNKAGKYLDVKSEVPYRGLLQVITKANLGPIKDLYIHIPAGTNRAAIQVQQIYPDGQRALVPALIGVGPYGNYVLIKQIGSGAKYEMTYPLMVWESDVYQLRDDTQGWYESSFPASPADEKMQVMKGKFRAGTLVSVSGTGEATGIPRYAQEWRKELASWGSAEASPPWVPVIRFAHDGEYTSLPSRTYCVVLNSSCPKAAQYGGAFFDYFNGAAVNQAACQKRAHDFHQFCGMTSGETSTSTFYENGSAKQTTKIGSECVIKNDACDGYPQGNYVGTFIDKYPGSADSAAACMKRASDFHKFCKMSAGQNSAATLIKNGQLIQSTTIGTACQITNTACPGYTQANYSGVFNDNYEGAGSSASRCLKRADDFYSFCKMSPGQSSTARYYSNGMLIQSKSVAR